MPHWWANSFLYYLMNWNEKTSNNKENIMSRIKLGNHIKLSQILYQKQSYSTFIRREK